MAMQLPLWSLPWARRLYIPNIPALPYCTASLPYYFSTVLLLSLQKVEKCEAAATKFPTPANPLI